MPHGRSGANRCVLLHISAPSEGERKECPGRVPNRARIWVAPPIDVRQYEYRQQVAFIERANDPTTRRGYGIRPVCREIITHRHYWNPRELSCFRHGVLYVGEIRYYVFLYCRHRVEVPGKPAHLRNKWKQINRARYYGMRMEWSHANVALQKRDIDRRAV